MALKQFVKLLDPYDPCCHCLSNQFTTLNKEKFEAGKFDRPQIRLLIKDLYFTEFMTECNA